MYMGELIEAAPMATPAMMRKTINTQTLCGKAVPRAEAKNSRPASISIRLRPSRSLRKPARAAPAAHPNSTLGRGPAFLEGRVEVEAGGQKADGPGDDGRVEAEQQAAEGRHDRQ